MSAGFWFQAGCHFLISYYFRLAATLDPIQSSAPDSLLGDFAANNLNHFERKEFYMKKAKLFFGAIAIALAPTFVSADTLPDVPIIGGMIMPMISYHSDDGMMHVMMPTNIPQLTPLLISYPGDNFDPTNAWFDALDPSREGLSFSRRYGFMMDTESDPLPSGTEMWIRELSISSADLKFYDPSDNAFAPIFGTDGSTNALYWDGVMFHPVVTAPPGTNNYSATFEVYLVNTATDQEVANSASTPFELNWTDVSDGRPALTASPGQGQEIVIAWPAGTTTNWVLASSSSLSDAAWTTVTNTPTTTNGQPCVIINHNASQEYFRMIHLP